MGDEPTEVHEHYDSDGELTGTTVVTRQPEWDDEQRAIALEQAQYERDVHHGCGTHISKSMDSSVARLVEHERIVCLDCRAIDKAREQYHKTNGHDRKNGACDCDDHIFYVAEYRPT